MKKLVLISTAYLMVVSFAFGQAIDPDARVGTMLQLLPGAQPEQASESVDNGFENVWKRRAYWFQRNAFPLGYIPDGAMTLARRQKAAMPVYRPSGSAAILGGTDWINKGPINIGGRIVTVAVNPLNPKTIYIGSADGGVWKTYDEGEHWFAVSDDLPTQAMGAIVVNPVDTSTVIIGTGEANFGGNMFEGAGMFRSTDGGSSWTRIGESTLPEYSRVSDLVINPNDPSIIYAAIPQDGRNSYNGGIFRTTDGGDTWTKVFSGLCTDVVINPQDPNILYTASAMIFSGMSVPNIGVFKTTDGGDTWSELIVPFGVADEKIGRTAVGISDENPDHVWLGVSNVAVGGRKTYLLGVFKTTDAGKTWEKKEVPLDYMVSQGWYDNIVGVNPKDPDIVIVGGVRMLMTTDGGDTWKRINDQGAGGILHVDQHAVAFNPQDPDRIYIGNDGGFFIISNNGDGVVKKDYGLAITQFIGGALHPSATSILFGGTQDNGTMYSDSPPVFEQILYGDGGYTYINPVDPRIWFTIDWGLSLFRSDDFGNTWKKALGGIPATERTLFYLPYVMDPNNPETLYLGSTRVLKTTNSGDRWEPLNDCLLPAASGGCYYLSALSVASYDSRVVMAGGANQVAISTDAGANWSVNSQGLPLRYCSSVHSFAPGEFYATYTGYETEHVFRSTDAGKTWAPVQGDLPDIPVNDLIAFGDTLIVATDIGVFISLDHGETYKVLGTGLPTIAVYQFLYHEATGILRAVTHGRGMYDIDLGRVADYKPVFVGNPPTETLMIGQPFLYAPVVKAKPEATFKLVKGPQGMTISPQGVLRWTASDLVSTVTIEATNSLGTATQTFELHTADVIPATDWQIVSREEKDFRVSRVAYADNTLWMTFDSMMVARSTDRGRTWERHRIPGNRAVVDAIFAFDAQTAIATAANGTVNKTTDGGKTWVVLRTDISTGYSISSNRGDHNLFFWNNLEGVLVKQGQPDSADIFLTSDGGVTWEPIAARPYAKSVIPGTLTFIDRDRGWFASSNRGTSNPTYADIIFTLDGGKRWRIRRSLTRYISSIAFLDKNTGFIVDRQSGTILRTVNGFSFFSYNAPMSGKDNHTVVTFPGTDYVWIVNSDEAWLSRDRGITWLKTRLVPTGMIQTAVFADTSHGWAFSGKGIVQEHRINPLTSILPSPEVPSRVSLAPAWPNPFNPAVTLKFSIPATMRVKLTILNALGKEVDNVLNEVMSQGEYYFTWDAGNRPSGVYFARLETAKEVVVGKLILAR